MWQFDVTYRDAVCSLTRGRLPLNDERREIRNDKEREREKGGGEEEEDYEKDKMDVKEKLVKI